MPPKVYRFALGSPASPSSALWRLWTREDEVHLSADGTRQPVEWTAYPTGRWRIVIGNDVSRWTRPREFRPGWTRGPDLIIPHGAVAIAASVGKPDPAETVTWLPAPAPGWQARFSLLLAAPRADSARWSPESDGVSRTLVVLPLRTAGQLYLSRREEPLDDAAGSPGPERTVGVVVSADQSGHPTLIETHGG